MIVSRRKFLFEIIKKIVSYIIVIVISVTLTAIGGYLFSNDTILFIELLVAILISAIIIGVVLYSLELLRTFEEFREKFFFKDVTVRDFSKTVKFSTDTKGHRICFVETTHDIENHMDEIYKQYLVEINSDFYAPSLSECNISLNGEPICLSEKDAEYELCTTKELDSEGHETLKHVTSKFYIPVEIEPKSTSSFTIQYPTTAYDNAYGNKTEFIGLRINQKTDRLRILVKLEGYTKNKYQLARCENFSGGRRKVFAIIDASDQRMLNYENILKEKGVIPQYSDDRITWTIYKPKVGYRYFVYFTLKEVQQNPLYTDLGERI